MEESIVLCNSDPHHLASSSIATLENLASQSKAKMKNLFIDLEKTRKIKLGSILEKLTQRHNRREQVKAFDVNQDDCENKNFASTQFLKIPKNLLIFLQEHLEQCCNVLLVFGFSRAKEYLNLINSYLLPILIKERDVEPIVIKKANQCISLKFGDVQLWI